MNLTGQHINHINSITHDGKVLVVGTAADGALHYSVKRSGFEDSALLPEATPFGFEVWKPLRLGESLEDPSVIADEQERLTGPDGTVLVRSVYGTDPEATRSADAPVQLVSLLGHVYVFRQTPGGKLLVNRFVLDGMLNELVPKLDVRFRRSRQRLEPLESVGVEDGTAVDSLDYRDMDGEPFYEPALELGFVGRVTGGWFSAVCVQTSESDRGRWHIFTGDAAAGLVIYSIGSTSSLPFDVGDHLYAQVDPNNAQQKTYRSIPGITRRVLALAGLAVSGRPSATLYDLQTEQLTDAGMQLLRGATRAMLAVPVRAAGDAATRTAALSFGIAADGTLSRIDPAPDAIDLLCSDAQEVLLPLDLLDDIREIATIAPPPAGTIAGIERGDEDRLAIRSAGALPADLAAGQRVQLRGTQSYDGHYKVLAVDGATFEIEATFERDEPGFWEVIPDEQTGLVFDNMIVGYAKTAGGKLQISCPAHDLKVGDEVQISGTYEYDGTYPVIEVAAGAPGFTLDAPFFTGEAANLSAVTRRGLRLDGDDHLETPALGHAAPSRTAALGRTLSAWLLVDGAAGVEQELVAEAAGLIALVVGADDKLEVRVRMSDGAVHAVRDPATLTAGAWVHVAATLAYDPATGGETRLALCRDGAEVARQAIAHAAPCHLRETVLDLSSGAYCDVAGGAALLAGRFTVACWANVTGGASSVRTVIACPGAGFTGFQCRADAQSRWEIAIGDGATWATVTGPAVVERKWTHLAATWDGATLALYVDGVAVGTPTAVGRAPAGGSLRFGAGGTADAAAEHFRGQLADVRVFGRALAAEELVGRMAQPPKDHDSSLTGYWPLDDGTPADRSLAKRHGVIAGAATWPRATFLLPAGDLRATPLDGAPRAGVYSIGRGCCGELADVQIWELARAPAEIADTRYLQLTGAEHGLAASYRLGAIVYEEPPIVPDFSVHGRDAIVYGDPYAGARRLDRATGSGMKVVAYASDEVIAVTQRATYEESFEFRVTSTDAAFDPADADGTGRPLFVFTYWGRASQTAPERIALSPGSYQQADFVEVGGGWYRASCRVTVPDGVPLLRAFEISDVRGTWGAEPALPPAEWTAIDIRKHRLRMISDVVTREGYTDRPALAALPAQAQEVLEELADVRGAEAAVARIEATIADLELRLEVASNNDRYVRELDTLEDSTLPNLQAQRSAAQTERAAIVADEYSYYQEFQAVHSGLWFTADGNNKIYQQHRYDDASLGWQRWRVTRLDATYCTLALKQNGKYLEVPGNGGENTHLGVYQTATHDHQRWKLEHISGPYYYIRSKSNGLVADVDREWLGADVSVICHEAWGANHQRWHRTTTSAMTDVATSAIAGKDKHIQQLDAQIVATQDRIAWLKAALASNEDAAALEAQLVAARADLATARTTLGTEDQELLTAALVRPEAAVMPVLATDDRGLATTGAVLDFVQPIGGVRAVESCEGNVQLSYVDHAGRLRLTCYDAAADSRNTTFEQWLPDAARACVDVRDSGDKITLAEAVTLPESGATCEAWFRWPAATQSTGSAYDANVVVSGPTAADAPLLIRGGTRLGLRVDGWYFDAGIDLSRVVAAGWHHFAASTRGTETGFFIDGVKVASRRTQRPALRFDGAASYLEVPAHASPTAAVTMSVWARSAGATWSDTSNLASKRDAFIMYPLKDSKGIRFYVFTTDWQQVEYTPADIQGWHHYTGTYDGHYLRLYIDGVVVVEKSVTGPINAASGPLYIGYDTAHPVPFKGDIAEVAVWSTARTLDEVSGDLYRSPNGDELGLVGCWRMERIEHAGAIKIRDVSPHGRHALLRGAPLDAAPTTQCEREVAVLGNAAGGGSPIGRLAEVRLWSAPLSDDEIAANARAVLTGHEPGLLAYWPLAEGSEPTARDRTAGGAAHGTLAGADWAGCTANLGSPGGTVLSLPDRGGAHVTCPNVPLASVSFTVELWARRSGASQNTSHYVVGMGTGETNKGLHIGFRSTNTFTMAFYHNDLDTAERYTDTDWHHWCCVYDQPTRAQRIYRDGVKVAERTASADFGGTGALLLGTGSRGGNFLGELADVRIWGRARTEAELRANLRLRLSGTEDGLLAYYPFDTAPEGGKVHDKVTGAAAGTLQGTARLVLTTELPSAGASDLVTAEYSTVEATADGTQQALMRRCLAFATAGQVSLVPEQRIEELILQWVGNTQINPTLLGYIEGAPPVPSENLTVEGDYDGAAAVSLMQSRDTVYTFQRTESHGEAFENSGFLGGAWERERGSRMAKTTTEGQVGAVWNYLYGQTEGNQSTTESSSTHTTTDRLTLSGRVEDKPMCTELGARYVPKNTGYALVVSGTADVFVTKLVRSGRMVGYDIRPLEGVPLDINTITFLINPTYTLNGTLDGLVGSAPADPTFYAHVPSMRSQYGSKYPASYFRIAEAYELAERITRMDMERESFFYNFDASDPASLDPVVGSRTGEPDPVEEEDPAETLRDQLFKEAKQRQEGIEKKYEYLEERVRAGKAFAEWQYQMTRIQTKAGKRNVVNTYVWDGDGGLRAEEQGFANTVEHSLGVATSHSGGSGGSSDVMYAGFKSDLSLVGSGSQAGSSGKMLNRARTLQLSLDLSGIERKGISDLRDNPLVPGEKVDRYRFMSFYLEGSTDHFHDFFAQVVDPEWLISNDEEARALRQAQAGKPNRCWRVLHRVTYVERPALMNLGQEAGTVQGTGGGAPTVEDRLTALEAQVAEQGLKLDEQALKLDEILRLLTAMAPPLRR